MLLRFQFSNFRSFRRSQELMMRDAEGHDLRVAAIYGANASGKTNVLEALRFMSRAVSGSHREWSPAGPVPVEPFALANGSAPRPSKFSATIEVDGIRFDYGFRAGRGGIGSEWLSAFPKGREQVWFSRTRRAGITLGPRLKGSSRAIAKLTRPNSLYLSAAAQNNHPELTPVYRWFAERLRFRPANPVEGEQIALQMWKEDRHRERLLGLLRLADVGIRDARQVNLAPDVRLATTRFRKGLFTYPDHPADPGPPGLEQRLELLHEAAGQPMPLPREYESSGTITWLSLLGPVLRALDEGGVLCMDEMDASLHPILAKELVSFFRDPAINRRRAQLIFTSQDAALLSMDAVSRDEIWFTEKNRHGESVLYPLSDFRDAPTSRAGDAYLHGRFGAVPVLTGTGFLTEGADADVK